ncbi:MAG: hypothetical protein JXO51_09595 [Candidatus Aminicenantes bacterium]|nr:hypothetical protein [Candidatus Aminicenantes bacterium]
MKTVKWASILAVMASHLLLGDQTLVVTLPHAGTDWCIGNPCTVTWTISSPVPGNVAIRLRRDGAPDGEPAAWILSEGTPAAAGVFSSTVPASLPPGRYFIRVKASATVMDDSPAFDVMDCTAPPGSITVTRPNSSSIWVTGSEATIRWTSINVPPGSVAIRLRRWGAPEDEPAVQIVWDSTGNDGEETWTIPFAVEAGDYAIRVKYNNDIMDDSAKFKIVAAGPSKSLTIVTPNGGETWRLGSEHEIRWQSSNVSGNVRLELVRYNDRTLGVIRDNQSASGSLSWEAGKYSGNTAPPGKYLLRVRSMADHEIFDESDAPFDLTTLIKQPSKPLLAKMAVTRKAQIKNWMGGRTHPSQVSPPVDLSVFQARPKCVPNDSQHAVVGAEWWQLAPGIRAGCLYRSQVLFRLDDLKGQGKKLRQATLTFRRDGHLCTGDARVSSCVLSICVLLTPWVKYDEFQIERINAALKQSGEVFRIDVTEAVRQWLDGARENHGFLLFGDELPTSKDFACFSCFTPSLVLSMD